MGIKRSNEDKTLKWRYNAEMGKFNRIRCLLDHWHGIANTCNLPIKLNKYKKEVPGKMTTTNFQRTNFI
jgi:hypothetical protein